MRVRTGPRLGWAGQGEGGLASRLVEVGDLGTVVLWAWALAAWRQTGGAGGQNKRRMKPAAEVSRAWRRHDKTLERRDRAGTIGVIHGKGRNVVGPPALLPATCNPTGGRLGIYGYRGRGGNVGMDKVVSVVCTVGRC